MRDCGRSMREDVSSYVWIVFHLHIYPQSAHLFSPSPTQNYLIARAPANSPHDYPGKGQSACQPTLSQHFPYFQRQAWTEPDWTGQGLDEQAGKQASKQTRTHAHTQTSKQPAGKSAKEYIHSRFDTSLFFRIYLIFQETSELYSDAE